MVRIGFFHFAFLGPDSFTAAEASECAAEQDGFWDYRNQLFEGQSSGVSTNTLVQFAENIGLDTVSFKDCLDAGRYKEIVEEQSAIGRQIGVQSTPTFIVNGQGIVGAQPYETFEQVIDYFLAQQ